MTICFQQTPKQVRIFFPIWVLAIELFQLEGLDEARYIVVATSRQQQWNRLQWTQTHYKEKTFSIKDFVFWFPKT
jgi:hypothetical protein